MPVMCGGKIHRVDWHDGLRQLFDWHQSAQHSCDDMPHVRDREIPDGHRAVVVPQLH
jgi:hypothetical protein